MEIFHLAQVENPSTGAACRSKTLGEPHGYLIYRWQKIKPSSWRKSIMAVCVTSMRANGKAPQNVA